MGKREMSSMSERQSSEEAVGDCVSALLSLSSPKCEDDYREHLSPTAPVNQRPTKVARTTSSTHTSKGVAQPSLDPGAKVWINQWVELVRGKYEGRRAFIVGMTTKKFRVRVVGVEHQLEFYPSMFKLSSGQLIEVPSPGPNELQLHPALANLSAPGTPKSTWAAKPVSISRDPSIEQMNILPAQAAILPAQADTSQKTTQPAPPPVAPKLSPIAGLSENPTESSRKSTTDPDTHSGASEDLVNIQGSPPLGPTNSGSTNGSRNHSTNLGNIEAETQTHTDKELA